MESTFNDVKKEAEKAQNHLRDVAKDAKDLVSEHADKLAHEVKKVVNKRHAFDDETTTVSAKRSAYIAAAMSKRSHLMRTLLKQSEKIQGDPSSAVNDRIECLRKSMNYAKY